MNVNFERRLKLTKLNCTRFVNSVKSGQLLKHRITVLCTEGAEREISMLIGQAYLAKLPRSRDAQHQFYTKNTVTKKESF